MLSNQDKVLIRDAALLPILLEMVNKEIDRVPDKIKQTLRPLYGKSLTLLRFIINVDLSRINRLLSKKRIRLVEMDSYSKGKTWSIIQRGSHEELLEMARKDIRSEISEKLSRYKNDTFNAKQGA